MESSPMMKRPYSKAVIAGVMLFCTTAGSVEAGTQPRFYTVAPATKEIAKSQGEKFVRNIYSGEYKDAKITVVTIQEVPKRSNPALKCYLLTLSKVVELTCGIDFGERVYKTKYLFVHCEPKTEKGYGSLIWPLDKKELNQSSMKDNYIFDKVKLPKDLTASRTDK